jgi:hypothetical protein
MALAKQKRIAPRTLVGKPEGKRTLPRLRCRWEVDLKMDVKETGVGVVVWINLGTGTRSGLL